MASLMTPAMLAKPRVAELRRAAGKAAAAPVSKRVVAKAQAGEEVSRRGVLSLAAVRARARGGGGGGPIGPPPAPRWRAHRLTGMVARCRAGLRRRAGRAPGERGVRRGCQRLRLRHQRVGCAAAADGAPGPANLTRNR